MWLAGVRAAILRSMACFLRDIQLLGPANGQKHSDTLAAVGRDYFTSLEPSTTHRTVAEDFADPMPRKFLLRYLPPAAQVRNHWLLSWLGHRLHHPRLWHLNRRSVAGAAGVGLFVAFLPLPFQMVFAALGALWLRVNLPLAVALIFITNPLTMGPVYYACYKLGASLLGDAPIEIGNSFRPSVEWLFVEIATIWRPLLAGSLVIGGISGLLGYWIVQLLWCGYIRYKRGSLLRVRARRS